MITPSIEVTKAGGHFRARFRGAANSVFGATSLEARQRLLNTPLLQNSQRNSEYRFKNWAHGFREVKTR